GASPPGPVHHRAPDGPREPEHEPGVRPVLDGDRFPGDVVAQALRQPAGLGLPRLREQDRELFPAEAPHQPGSLQVLGHRAGDALEDLVARFEPAVSFTLLKWSMSTMTRASGASLRSAR